jgi:serine/threonine-protein phosphatase 2B regulatory subunit
LKILYKKFLTLDKDASGSVSLDEFLKIPQLAANPLLARIVRLFDKDGNDEVEFNEFIGALATFHSGTSQDKLKFVFKIYDIDGDGFISNGELFKVLKMMVGDNLNDVQLQQLVDKTIIKADTDNDGKVSFDEFLAIVDNKSSDKLKLNIDAASKAQKSK